MNSTTGKVDQRAIATALSRKEPAAPAAPIVPVVKVEEVKAKGPVDALGHRTALDDQKPIDGKPVATSATMAELYGSKFDSPNPPIPARTPMTRAQAEAKLKQLEAKKTDLETRMGGRATELDAAWKTLNIGRKIDALKVYLGDTKHLPPAQKTELAAAIQTTVEARTELNAVRDTVKDDVKKLAIDPNTKKHGTPEERRAKAIELLAARKAHRETVAAAVDQGTETIDKAGLKVERLAITEQIIDPSGGANSKFGSMGAMYGEYYETMFTMQSVQKWYFGPFAAIIEQVQKNEGERAANARRADEVRQDWQRDKDMQVRALMQDISTNVLKIKAPIEAEKTGDLGKAPVSSINASSRRAE